MNDSYSLYFQASMPQIKNRNYLLNDKITTIFYFLFYLLILAAPLVIYGTSIRGISVRFSRIIIILMAPVMLLKIMMKPALIYRDDFLIIGVLPYLIYTTISASWSPNIETGTTVSRLGGLYEVMIVYTIFTVADLNSERFQKFVKYYILSALIPLGISFWQLANNMLQFSLTEVPFDFFLIPGRYELLESRVFVLGGGFSRITSTFAEPVIFSCFMASALLFSLLLDVKNYLSIIALRLFQLSIFVIVVLSMSKLSLIFIVIGALFIAKRTGKFKILFVVAILFIIIVGVMYHYDMLFIFDRLLWGTGHCELLIESIRMMESANFFFGEGIGSVPCGSFHRFMISRIYESGIVGLVFVLAVSIIPFKILSQKMINDKSQKIKNICVGVIFAVIFGLHAYDYFIHLFPWIVIGAIMSFYNSEKIKDSRYLRLSNVSWRPRLSKEAHGCCRFCNENK